MEEREALVLGVSDFVALLNQTLEYAFPNVTIISELANFRVSKNRWVYFDLKDEESSVKFFGTVYQLPGPLEDGMMLQVRGVPRLHPLYGFSVTTQAILPVGEGSIRRASELLMAKLEAEGLFDVARKRHLPYPPKTIGLIASGESAAYVDFTKILNQRWSGVEVQHADVQVQGEAAIMQVVRAIEYFNQQAAPPEILVITRGGGSAEDLGVFSTEQVTRAVAASRIPTLVAIGHEVDISLAELAADQRASTPSNAAELLVPDKTQVTRELAALSQQLGQSLTQRVRDVRQAVAHQKDTLHKVITQLLKDEMQNIRLKSRLLAVLNPQAALSRGYALVRSNGKVVRSIKQLQKGTNVDLQLADGTATANIQEIG